MIHVGQKIIDRLMEEVNRCMDRQVLKIFLPRYLDSEKNFNGFVEPYNAADYRFIPFMGLDFGFFFLHV